MGEKRQIKEKIKVSRKLLSMNLKRVMAGSACLFATIPLFLLYTGLFREEAYTLVLSPAIIILLEVICAAFFFLSFFTVKTRDRKYGNIITKAFWLFYLVLSMFIIYYDRLSGAGYVFYTITLCVLAVGPLFSFTERIYYTAIQAVFIIVMISKFGAQSKEIFDLVLANLGRAALSAALYNGCVSRLLANEQLKEIRENDVRDPLTGFMNRKALENAVDAVWEDSKQKRKRMSMLIVDIDNFKEYNNTFGYETGDKCISRIGENLGRIVGRDTDIVCRLTGGRFVVFLNGSDEQEPLLLAEKLRTSIERMRIPLDDNTLKNRFITVSIGVSTMEPGFTTTFAELYDEADSALYAAKEYGRNLIVYDEHVYGRKTGKASFSAG